MKAVNVAITGCAGQIGYALAFRVTSGAVLGPDTRVNLHMLEISPALGALQGILMELNDCAFATLGWRCATVRSPSWSERGRADPAWSARTCCSPTRRFSRLRARPLTRWPTV